MIYTNTTHWPKHHGQKRVWFSMGLVLALAISGCDKLYVNQSPEGQTPDIEVFFSNPETPFQDNALSKALKSFINQAQGSLDIALHDLGETTVMEALLAACRRGVAIRMILDPQVLPNNLRTLVKQRCFQFHIVNPTRKQHGLMHHKLVIRDRHWVWTGSANWTSTGLFLNANDAVRIDHAGLAAAFQRQFDWLFSGGYSKAYRIPTDPGPFQSGSASVRAYFSPDPQIETEIVRQLNQAQKSIRLAMFYLTNDRLYRALLDAMARGVRVSALLSHRGAGHCDVSEMDELITFGKGQIAPIRGAFHHKFVVIDGLRVVTGSANWTKSAFEKNFENVLVIEDKHVAARYVKQFDHLINAARAYRRTAQGPVRLVYRHFNTVPGTARVEWHPIQAPAVAGYEICKSTTASGGCITRTRIKNPAAWFWVDRAVKPGSRVYYRVSTITEHTKGTPSAPLEVHISTPAPVFTIPGAIDAGLIQLDQGLAIRFTVAGVRRTRRGDVLLLSNLQRSDAFQVFVPACALSKGFWGFDFQDLEGQVVVVNGALTFYRGPEIIVYDHGQLTWSDDDTNAR